MALYKDLSTVLNTLNAQSRGEDTIATADLTGCIAEVKSSLSSADYKDAFMGSLASMVTRFWNRYLSTAIKYPAINVDSEQFGAMVAKNDIAPFVAVTNTEISTGGDSYAPNFASYDAPSVTQRFFVGYDTWAEKMKLTDELLDSAFHSEAELASFIDAVMSAFGDAQVQHQNKAQDMALANYIAECLHEGGNVVNIRSLYNEKHGTSYTIDECLLRQDFHQYACMIIDKFKTYLTAPDGTAVFNAEHAVRRSDPDDVVAFFLTDFVSAYKTYLLNGVSILNNDLLKLGAFYEVQAWQGTSLADYGKPDLGATSRIDVTTSAGNSVAETGIIGALIDKRGLATAQLKYRSAVDRWNGDGVTFYTQRARASYINDFSENAIIFTMS